MGWAVQVTCVLATAAALPLWTSRKSGKFIQDVWSCSTCRSRISDYITIPMFRAWHFRYFLLFEIKNDFSIKLIWLWVGFLDGTGADKTESAQLCQCSIYQYIIIPRFNLQVLPSRSRFKLQDRGSIILYIMPVQWYIIWHYLSIMFQVFQFHLEEAKIFIMPAIHGLHLWRENWIFSL